MGSLCASLLCLQKKKQSGDLFFLLPQTKKSLTLPCSWHCTKRTLTWRLVSSREGRLGVVKGLRNYLRHNLLPARVLSPKFKSTHIVFLVIKCTLAFLLYFVQLVPVNLGIHAFSNRDYPLCNKLYGVLINWLIHNVEWKHSLWTPLFSQLRRAWIMLNPNW